MLQSYHQSAECFEIIFNKAKYDALPPELQAILKYAAESASADMSWKAMDRYSKDLEAMKAEQGVKVHKTPDSVLAGAARRLGQGDRQPSQEPFFAKVVEIAEGLGKARASTYSSTMEVDQKTAFDHFFPA